MNQFRQLFLCCLFLACGNLLSAQNSILYLENFNDNGNGWTVRDDEKAFAGIQNGKYRMSHKRTNGSWLFWQRSMPIDGLNDFELETEFKQVSGPVSHPFGLIWGAKDAGNLFGFVITSDGRFKVYKYQDYNRRELHDYERIEEGIIAPQGQPNKLSVIRSGKRITFFINDIYVWSTTFQRMYGERIGFVLSNQMEVHATRLVVNQLKPLPITFRENFSSADHSFRGEAEDGTQVADGKFLIKGQAIGRTTIRPVELEINPKNDFEIESHMKIVEGRKDKGYGLVWGGQDGDNTYVFMVNTFGAYHIFRRKNGVIEKITDWTPTDAELIHRDKPNKLAIKKRGDNVNFYLNDIYLDFAPFEDFFGSKFGFAVNDTMLVAVDDLVIRQGEVKEDRTPPAISWVNPASHIQDIESNKLIFKAGFRSNTVFDRASLYVNDVMVGAVGKGSAGVQGFDAWIEQEIDLKPGENTIKLIARNLNGTQNVETRVLKVKGDNTPLRTSGNDYALFFATDKYTEWSDLVNPVNDVKTIAGELEEHYGFNIEMVINPTRKEVLRKLKEYARRQYKDNDQLLIFFAGHGKFDEFFGEGYVVCSDSRKDDEGNDSYIPHSSLRTIINNIPAKHVFLTMDVCFGGTIDPFIASSGHRGEDDTYKEMTQTEFVKRKLKFRTRRYLTSGGKEYVPDGTPGQHSPFARKFLEALRNYGGHDKIITLSELLLYFERLLPEPRFGEFGTNQPGSDFLLIAQ